MINRLPFLILLIWAQIACSKPNSPYLRLFKANNPNIQYFGRVDFSNPLKPKFWSPGVYIKAKFEGSECELVIIDEVLGGDNHNYIEITIDYDSPLRIKLTNNVNILKVAQGLTNTEHIITICKDTESGIGYLEFVGLRCKTLLPLQPKPSRKIEYIGDSITSGTAMDFSEIPCDKGQWYDQHNAYMSYGPRTSRMLDAQWQLTAVAGIGLTHSCCNMDIVMPDVFDKVYLRNNKTQWDFSRYQANVVTICLGQNDGITDSARFCNAYVQLIGNLRTHYPHADIICLTSPMAENALSVVLKKYLSAITSYMNNSGDKKVYKYFFSKRYHSGCGGHPDINEHAQIADELSAYIKQVEDW